MLEESILSCSNCKNQLMGKVPFCPYCGEMQAEIADINSHPSPPLPLASHAYQQVQQEIVTDGEVEDLEISEESNTALSASHSDKQNEQGWVADEKEEETGPDNSIGAAQDQNEVPFTPDPHGGSQRQDTETSVKQSRKGKYSIGLFVVIFLAAATAGGGAYVMGWFDNLLPRANLPGSTQSSQPGIFAKCPDAENLVLDARTLGNALSLSVSQLPKVRKVLESAQKLASISSAYQEQLKFAQETVQKTQNRVDTDLKSYKRKMLELARLDSQQFACGFDQVRNFEMNSRQKRVVDLLTSHQQVLHNNTNVNSESLLKDFVKQFSDLND